MSTDHRILNVLQTTVLFIGMNVVVGLLGYILAGWTATVWIILLMMPVILLSPRISPQLVLSLYGAQPLRYDELPAIHKVTRQLSERGDLAAAPKIYYLPTHMATIFTVGRKSDATIVISLGILELLNHREISGVIAHEIAHIRNNDLWIMSIADFISRVTGILSVMGLVMIMLLLPLLILSGNAGSMFAALAVVTFSPYFNILLQLALSRVREYRADITAAYLMGDTRALASALQKIESSDQSWFEQLLFPGKTTPVPSIFRTHPPTPERIKRLRGLELPPHITPLLADEHETVAITLSPFNSRRRDFLRGLWF